VVVAKALEELGVHLAPVITDDAYGFTLYGPRAAFNPASELLAEILREPAFDPDDVAAESRRMESRIRGLADRPREFSLDRFRREIFGDHPYGLPRPGDAEALARLDAPSAAAWHSQNLTAGNLVLSVAGDLETAEVTAQLGRLFSSLPAGEAVSAPPFDPAGLALPREVKVTNEGSQTTTVAGYPVGGATADDLHALDLIAYFCQGDGGRFYDEIRSKRGLAYVVHALNVVRMTGGYFLGFSATAHDKAAQAREIFLTEFRRLWEAPPTAEELARTKEFCLGMRLVRYRRTSLSRALGLAAAEILGQGYAFESDYEARLRAVTLDQFVETARRRFPEGRHVVVTVGK
jgi:zinc protease